MCVCFRSVVAASPEGGSQLSPPDVVRLARVVAHLAGVRVRAVLVDKIGDADRAAALQTTPAATSAAAGSDTNPDHGAGALGICAWVLHACAGILLSLARYAPPEVCSDADLHQAVLEAAMTVACLAVPMQRAEARAGGSARMAMHELPAGVSEGEAGLLRGALDTALTAAQEVLGRRSGGGGSGAPVAEGGALLEAGLEAALGLFLALPGGAARARLQQHLRACLGAGLAGSAGQRRAASAAVARLSSLAGAAVAGRTAEGAAAGGLLPLLAAVSLPRDGGGGGGGASDKQRAGTLRLLRRALAAESSPPALKLEAVQSLQLIQQAGADWEAGTATSNWAASCFLHLAGHMVALVLTSLQPKAPEPAQASGGSACEEDWGFQSADSGAPQLSDENVAMAGAAIKSVMLGLRMAEALDAGGAAKEGELSGAVMRLLLPLLLACGAPDDGAPSSPALRAMGMRLITHLAQGQGAATAAFKGCIAALPAAGKRRLQSALVQSQAGAAAAKAPRRDAPRTSGMASPAAAPAIKFNLSNFSTK
eukprot:jgi/Tetstr1/448075/TSEL_035374.t1